MPGADAEGWKQYRIAERDLSRHLSQVQGSNISRLNM
jgi:hypothetical protein